MRTLYFDCFSGASGDMLLGALVDLGVDVEALKAELAKLPLDGYHIETTRVVRSSLAATKVDVVVGGKRETVHGRVVDHEHEHTHDHEHEHEHTHDHEHEHTHVQAHTHSHDLGEILDMIDSSNLSPDTRSKARRVFERLGEAEAHAHGVSVADVHFHEVGAVDAIVDVVGALIGFELLGVERFVCSPINVGGGSVTFSHGTYPVPAPATAELLKGVPVYSGAIQKELLTPTGAAILTTIADDYGPLPNMVIARIGYGAGARDIPKNPNVLRLVMGETDRKTVGNSQSVVVIEATIDDMTPEAFGFFVERALDEGALDVFLTPVVMKKNRPGVEATLLVTPNDLERMVRFVFRESTTIGLRHREVSRRVLDRELVLVDTPVGAIRVKVARLDGVVVTAAPEYDDCREAALRTGLPLRDVQAMASSAYNEKST